MTLSLQDRRLRAAHAEFARAADDVVRPAVLIGGLLRAAVALVRTAIASRVLADPIALRPRVLQG